MIGALFRRKPKPTLEDDREGYYAHNPPAVMACKELGLRCQRDAVVDIKGERVKTVALIPDLGAKKGMLLVYDYALISGITSAITDAGYRYTVLSRPGASGREDDYELDAWKEIFRDWGWYAKGKKPAWM